MLDSKFNIILYKIYEMKPLIDLKLNVNIYIWWAPYVTWKPNVICDDFWRENESFSAILKLQCLKDLYEKE